jgi:hypothetical protein
MKHAQTRNKEISALSLPLPSLLLWLTFAILIVASPQLAQAQEWRFEPIVRVGGEYDDNARLDNRTDREVKLEGFLVDLKANINYSSAKTSFFMNPSVLLRNYPDEPDYDSDDYFLDSRLTHQLQSSTIGFRARFDQQSVRTGERAISDLEIDDPDEITDDDSGRGRLLFGDRSKWLISPFWDYQLSDTSTIGVNLQYSDVQYEDVFANVLADYTDARLNLTYRRKLSDVQTGLLNVTGRRYDSQASLGETTGYGVMAGFERVLSEKTSLTAMIGVEDSKVSELSFDPEVVGYVRLIRNLETIRMFAEYRRSVSASGSGSLQARDSVSLNFRRRLNEKISAGLGVRAYESGGIGGVTTIDDRSYVQLRSSVLWYLSTSFVIEASYRYTVNDRSTFSFLGERANANQVNIWFTYQPRTIPKI